MMNEQLLAEGRAIREILRNKSCTQEQMQACFAQIQELRKTYSWDEIWDVANFVATELEGKQ